MFRCVICWRGKGGGKRISYSNVLWKDKNKKASDVRNGNLVIGKKIRLTLEIVPKEDDKNFVVVEHGAEGIEGDDQISDIEYEICY